MDKVVVLASGGLDSTTALYQARSEGKQVTALFCRYASHHNARERQAFDLVVADGGFDWAELTIPTGVYEQLALPLMVDGKLEAVEYRSNGPQPTEIPLRNIVMIASVAAWAMARHFEEVHIAAHATDSHGWAYPDCSPEVLGALAAAIWVGSSETVRLRTPFLYMSKANVVQRAALLRVPVELTWSCYAGREEACGVCGTCKERLHAFAVCSYIDPIKYEIPVNMKTAGVRWPYLASES